MIRIYLFIGTLILAFLLASSAPNSFLYNAQKKTKYRNLELAAEQGNAQAMYWLAKEQLRQQQSSEALFWLEKSLTAGYMPALTALLENAPYLESRWYRLATQDSNFHTELNALLYEWKFLEAHPEKLLLKLQQSTQEEVGKSLQASFVKTLIKFIISHDDVLKHLHWQSFIHKSKDKGALFQALEAGAERFEVGFKRESTAAATPCDYKMNFVFASKEGRYQGYVWVGQLANFLIEQGLHLCVEETRLPVPSQLDCSTVEGRAYCHNRDLFEEKLPVELKQAVQVYVTPEGTANTRNGVVFIAETGSWKLLLHELGHALGLADEYPMQREYAQAFCSGKYAHPSLNLRVVHQQAFRIERGDFKYPVETCLHTKYQAYKSVAKATFMEFYESNYVPRRYLEWMKEQMQLRNDKFVTNPTK